MAYRPNPTRRNRNIGTPKQGHGRDNRDVLPERYREALFDWKRGAPHRVVFREVFGRQLPFLVEETRADSAHACTPDDIARVLRLLPREHVASFSPIKDVLYQIDGVQGVVLGQPVRSADRHRGAWGRMRYFESVNEDFGPVIFIEAQTYPLKLSWGRKLNSADKREQERIRECAEHSVPNKRGTDFHFDLDAVRRLQLYHTLPHEIGHWVHKLEFVKLPGLAEASDYGTLLDRFYEIPANDKEEFAHRYADEARARLSASGALPFERLFDEAALAKEGLRPEDFRLE